MSAEVLFGTRLRTERERRGVSLDVVAQHTKINRGLFVDMERGRFDRWPPGIFGRAFIRGYAEAVGLDAHAIVSEYVALVSDEQVPRGGEASKTLDPNIAAGRGERGSGSLLEERGDDGRGVLRLVLADEVAAAANGVVPAGHALKLAGAAVDAALVLVPAGVAAWLAAGTAAWVSAGLVGLSALVAATAMIGGSPGFWLVASRRERPVLLDVFEEPVDDLFLSPTRFGMVPDLDDGDPMSAPDDRDAETRRGGLVVSPEFYRPSGTRRYGQRARHA